VVEDQHTVPKAQETAPSIEVNKDIPDPPKRTSSLNKAASVRVYFGIMHIMHAAYSIY